MALLAKSDNNFEKERPVAGMAGAICAFVADLGKHYKEFNNEKKLVHQVVFCWEIDQKLKTGKYAGLPFMVSKRYTLSLHEKSTLSKDIESWIAKKIPAEIRLQGFDLETMIGKKCTLSLIQHESGAVGVSAVLPPMINNDVVRVCDKLPEWILKEQNAAVKTETNDFDQRPTGDAPPHTDADAPNDLMPWEHA